MVIHSRVKLAVVAKSTTFLIIIFSQRFEHKGWWRWNSKKSQVFLKNLLYHDTCLIYSNFMGRKLRVPVLNNWAYFEIKKLADGSVVPVAGIDFMIMKTIAEKLNFT